MLVVVSLIKKPAFVVPEFVISLSLQKLAILEMEQLSASHRSLQKFLISMAKLTKTRFLRIFTQNAIYCDESYEEFLDSSTHIQGGTAAQCTVHNLGTFFEKVFLDVKT